MFYDQKLKNLSSIKIQSRPIYNNYIQIHNTYYKNTNAGKKLVFIYLYNYSVQQYLRWRTLLMWYPWTYWYIAIFWVEGTTPKCRQFANIKQNIKIRKHRPIFADKSKSITNIRLNVNEKLIIKYARYFSMKWYFPIYLIKYCRYSTYYYFWTISKYR